MKIISYNDVNVRGVDGNIEVTTSGEVNVHFDHVGEHQISSIYCDPWNDLSTINVSVEVGNVNVPVFDIEEIIGDVKVLFVNVCVEVNWTIFEFVIDAILVAVAALPVVSAPLLGISLEDNP